MERESGAARLTFSRAGAGRFQLGPAAIMVMSCYVQDVPEKTEAGGVLLGRHLLGTSDVIVDCVTDPMGGDRRSRFRFFRARKPHQEAVDQAWRRSGGTCVYLGEWHTHPEPHPSPSHIDWKNWQLKLRHNKFGSPLFFVIVGTATTSVWEGFRDPEPQLLRNM